MHSRKELIIPGSSLKGAVRTQVLNEFIQKDPWFVQEPHHLKKRNNFSDGQMQSHYLAKRGDDRVDGKV